MRETINPESGTTEANDKSQWEVLTFPAAAKEYGFTENMLREAANRTCGPRLRTVGRGGGRRIARKHLHEWIESAAV